MRDFETTVMDAMDVETSFDELCKKMGSGNSKKVQALREHDVCQEMKEEEQWTVLSKIIMSGESVSTIRSESTKKDQIVGGRNFHDDASMAVSCCERDSHDCQSIEVDCWRGWIVCDWCV